MDHLYCRLNPVAQTTQVRTYWLAGQLLAADCPLAPLAPHERSGDDAGAAALRAAPALKGPARAVVRQTGWVGNSWRDVRAWRHDDGYRVRIADVGDFSVAADGGVVALVAVNSATGSAAIAETLLGPPLILALALRGVWCLHASAVAIGGAVIAFAGESGAGKSTLAAFLHATGGGACCLRVADDILPVRLGPAGLYALPHFPQLKLPDAGQYPPDAPPRMPLKAIYRLEGAASPLRLLSLGLPDATKAIIGNTVASRLFDGGLLARHLGFCAEAAGRVQVHSLGYPHRTDSLQWVQRCIEPVR